MSAPLSCQELVLSRSGSQVLTGLSFDLHAGEITLLLGRNGAGKSTLLDALCGILAAEEGSTTLAEPQLLGVLRQEPMLWRNLTVFENLSMFGALHGLSRSHVQAHLDSLALTSLASCFVDTLSTGQRTLVSFALALLGKPKNLILDEPTACLDDSAATLVCTKAQELAKQGGFVLIATHDLTRLQHQATRAIVLHNGKVLSDSALSGSLSATFLCYQEVNR